MAITELGRGGLTAGVHAFSGSGQCRPAALPRWTWYYSLDQVPAGGLTNTLHLMTH